MKNKKTMNMLALGIIALLGVGMVAAYQGDYSKQGPDYSEDRHEAMTMAFENANYEAWVAVMSESGRQSKVMSVINAENFAVFVEAHEAGKAGDFEKAAELKAKLGLGSKNGSGFEGDKGMRHGSMQGSKMKGQSNNGACPSFN